MHGFMQCRCAHACLVLVCRPRRPAPALRLPTAAACTPLCCAVLLHQAVAIAVDGRVQILLLMLGRNVQVVCRQRLGIHALRTPCGMCACCPAANRGPSGAPLSHARTHRCAHGCMDAWMHECTRAHTLAEAFLISLACFLARFSSSVFRWSVRMQCMQCGAPWRGMVRCAMVRCSVVRCSAVQCSAVHDQAALSCTNPC